MKTLIYFAAVLVMGTACNIAARQAERQQANFYEYAAQHPITLDSFCAAALPPITIQGQAKIDSSALPQYNEKINDLGSLIDTLVVNDTIGSRTAIAKKIKDSVIYLLGGGSTLAPLLRIDTVVTDAPLKAVEAKYQASQAQVQTLTAQLADKTNTARIELYWLIGGWALWLITFIVLIYRIL